MCERLLSWDYHGKCSAIIPEVNVALLSAYQNNIVGNQENCYENPELRVEAHNSSSDLSTVAQMDNRSHVKKLHVQLEAHEIQDNFTKSPNIGTELSSSASASSIETGTYLSSVPSGENSDSQFEAHMTREKFTKNPSIGTETSISSSGATIEVGMDSSSPFLAKKLDSQPEVCGNKKFEWSPNLRTEVSSFSPASSIQAETNLNSAPPVEKLDPQLEVHENKNFHKSSIMALETSSSSSASFSSAETDLSSLPSGEKTNSQTEENKKQSCYKRPKLRIETPSFSSVSFSSALTDISTGKKSDTQLTSSQDSEGKGGRVYSMRSPRCRREGVTTGEKWSSSDSHTPSIYSVNVDIPDGLKSDIQHIMSRQRSASLASIEYYRTEDTTLQVSEPEGVQGAEGGVPPPPDRHIQQSRRLPFWMWLIIAKSLGIKLHSQDKPILATVLYTLTFASALGFILSNWWFMGYDMASDYTKTTVIDATVSMFYVLLWGALGLYANKLAYKLFSHKKFVDMLRLHSKTILKMNASVVLLSLMLLIAIFNNISAYPNFKAKACLAVGVEVLVCRARYVFRVIYSFFAVLWNYLVAFVLVSTCRTHVIGIRRFMKALEKDARMYESRIMGQTQPPATERPILEEYTWVDEDYLEDLTENSPGTESESGVSLHSRRQRNSGESQDSEQEAAAPSSTRGPATISSTGSLSHTSSSHSLQSEAVPNIRKISTASFCFPTSPDLPSAKTAGVMTNAEILFRFWKIQSRLRMSSMALQRWMMSILALVVTWLAMNLIIWLTYNPSLIDLANFFLPLTLLPLLASAYAEVNQEGQRLLKFICPLEERLQMIFVLQRAPLQMTVYGFSLSYSTITTAAFGILLAFASKVLIQEISGGTITVGSSK